MGTFANYYGNKVIPDGETKAFSEQMIRILFYGGMMDIDVVDLYGYRLGMLKPVSLQDRQEVDFYYNYFEDDSWEEACYSTESTCLWSNKIGGAEFCDVILAGYTLYELYDRDKGAVELSGEVFDNESYIAWINNILGTEFTSEKRFHLWDMAEAIAYSEGEYYSGSFSHIVLNSIFPKSKWKYIGGVDFADLCYITNGTESLTKDQVRKNSYPCDVLNCKNSIIEYFQCCKESGIDEESAKKKLWDLLTKERNERKVQSESLLKKLAEMSLYIPARVFIYLTSEYRKEDFWLNWKEMSDKIYHDEETRKYASEKIIRVRKKVAETPVAGMSTSEFLKQNDWFTFSGTPEELYSQPKYFISDADRLYWWDGSDEVKISKRTDRWLKSLAKRHAELMESETVISLNADEDSDSQIKSFYYLLTDIDKYYKRILPFQTMFYDFLRNLDRKEYHAAISLLRELYEENKEEGAAIQYLKGSWDLCSRKVTFNPGRLKMKRIMSVMANKKLRQKYFGF